MLRHTLMACLFGLLVGMPLAAQEPAYLPPAPPVAPDNPLCPIPLTVLVTQPQTTTAAEVGLPEASTWETVWGVVGLRVIPEGPKTAPNGGVYHPNFSIDLNFNFWIWREQRLYLFADARLWGERGEYGVTNSRDGFMGTSKREFDLSGGAAWNYYGPWEARAFGYTNNNLNRGYDAVAPTGFTDGFGLENRYYLSSEYAKLGQTGFDVARATFLSIGYYPSKVMMGNNGQPFKPGMMLRAYLIYDLWDWPCYVYGDATYLSEQSLEPRLFLFDVGVAVRPFSSFRQWEMRLGVENTGDFQAHDVQNLWYASFRFIF